MGVGTDLMAESFQGFSTGFNKDISRNKPFHAVYDLNGLKHVAFLSPLNVGDKFYAVAGTVPVREFHALAESLKENAKLRYARIMKALGLSCLIFDRHGGDRGSAVFQPHLPPRGPYDRRADRCDRTNPVFMRPFGLRQQCTGKGG